jgi:asparagine synthase (glutamine-hydrolysing)
VPQALVERPKMGFAIPLGDWLRGPLRDWAENLLAPDRLRDAGFFHVGAVRNVWDDHVSGRANRQYMLWNVLMFEAWRDRWG